MTPVLLTERPTTLLVPAPIEDAPPLDTTRREFITGVGAAALAAAFLAACGEDDPAEATPAADAAFPVTIQHKHGETTIPAKPMRVVSVGYQDRDAIVVLGAKPLGVRFWALEYTTLPWAKEALGDFTPEVIGVETELDFEAIAALNPDVLIGVTAYMPREEYDQLSQIAPTIADHAGFPDGGAPWREQLRLIGQILGRASEAEEAIARTEAHFAQIRAAHPEFEGKTVAFAYYYPGGVGIYSSKDIRTQMLEEIGFVIPEEFDALAGDAMSSFEISEEQFNLLEADVLFWATRTADLIEEVRALPLREQLAAVQDGREIFVSDMIGTAFAYGSPLSIPYLLEQLTPKLVAALDGDAATSTD